jgi:hypothetical protein
VVELEPVQLGKEGLHSEDGIGGALAHGQSSCQVSAGIFQTRQGAGEAQEAGEQGGRPGSLYELFLGTLILWLLAGLF